MSWASDRLGWLDTRTDWETITAYTGISEVQYDALLTDQYQLSTGQVSSLASFYGKQIYAYARANGLTPQVAARLRNRSVSNAVAYIEKSSAYINDLVDYRIESYTEYLKANNRYISDADTRAQLYDAISKSAGKSRKNNAEDFWKNSPSLQTILVDDDNP